MPDRKSLVMAILAGEIKLPFSLKTDKPDTEHKYYYRILERRTRDVGITKDKDKSQLWFYSRKKA